MIWSAPELAEALNVKVNSKIITGEVQFNSQDVKEGDLFIVLQGNNDDGHKYVKDALAMGAGAVIISKQIDDLPIEKVIKVEDTLAALYKLAEYKRKTSKAKFIAVTGSVGKTSTKEATKLMLSGFGEVFASRGNFNNHLGVPINLASMSSNTEYAIFEIGMNHAGEIRGLTKMVRPDIAIITNVSEAHLQFFNSVEEIADAKCEIFEGLAENGAAIINSDNKYYDRILSNLKKLNIKNIFTFGKNKQADSRLKSYEKSGDKVRLEYALSSQPQCHSHAALLHGSDLQRNYAGCKVSSRRRPGSSKTVPNTDIILDSRLCGNDNGERWNDIISIHRAKPSRAGGNPGDLQDHALFLLDPGLRWDDNNERKQVTLHLPFIAEHYAKNFAAGFMVVSVLGLDVNIAAMQLSKIELTLGRGRIVKVNKGGKNFQLLCDYYNASPESMKASLIYLKQIDYIKKIAIIGDMLELGDTSAELHKNLVPFIIDSGVSKVILVGSMVKHIYESLPRQIKAVCFDNVDLLLADLDNLIEDGGLILIKGSNSIKLDKVTKYFGVI